MSTAAAPSGPRHTWHPGLVLDRWFGRVSMYRLVAVALAVILASGLVLAAAGVLTLDVAAIALTAVVAVVASVAGTLLGAGVLALVRGGRSLRGALAAPHWLSPVVTGLIMALVLQPVGGAGLLGVAGAGLVAGLSKYVIAWRGRHVLNPAVVGLLVAGWFGWAHSWWWVGAAAISPVVLLTGLVILWRTRRLAYAASYLVPAAALTTLGYAGLGTALPTALSYALLSSPVLFLAAFMLTEPLTTPPRRWQRIAIGVLVGVASAAPLLWGWLWLSPELALAIGNAVAFGLGPRRRVGLRFVRRVGAGSGPAGSVSVGSVSGGAGQTRSGQVLDLRFTASSPLRFQPGQYVEIDVPRALAAPGAARDPRGRRRVLSVASAPSAQEVRLVTRLAEPEAEPSPVKRALAALEQGDEVAVTLVGGDFLLPREPSALLGAGIGITPFLSMLDALACGEQAPPEGGWDVVVVHAVRDVGDVVELTTATPPEVPGGGVLGALPARAVLPAGVDVVLVVPPGTDRAVLPVGCRVVEGWIADDEVLAAAVPDLAARRVLVSGSPSSVAAIGDAARAQGARRVETDVFLGY